MVGVMYFHSQLQDRIALAFEDLHIKSITNAAWNQRIRCTMDKAGSAGRRVASRHSLIRMTYDT